MTGPDQLTHGLAAALARINLPAPEGLERLSGGANMESWRFRAGDVLCVLRRAPSLEMMAGRPMDHAGEAQVVRAARAAGVMAPEVLVELEPGDGIGSGYVMRAISGSPDPNAFLAEADPALAIRDIARELVATHRTDCTGVPVPVMDTASALAELRSRFMAYGGDRPILALALRWLEANIPPPVAPSLVHGDFRLGNLMFEHGRVTGVLDWELAHLGDWHENGSWAAHLHFQIITDLLAQTSGNFFGVGQESLWDVWQSVSPDPNLILRLPPRRFHL